MPSPDAERPPGAESRRSSKNLVGEGFNGELTPASPVDPWTGRAALGGRVRRADHDYWRRRRLASLIGVELEGGRGIVHLAVFTVKGSWLLCSRSLSRCVPSTSNRRLCRDCERGRDGWLALGAPSC
jgi:hypothetical protein